MIYTYYIWHMVCASLVPSPLPRFYLSYGEKFFSMAMRKNLWGGVGTKATL